MTILGSALEANVCCNVTAIVKSLEYLGVPLRFT